MGKWIGFRVRGGSGASFGRELAEAVYRRRREICVGMEKRFYDGGGRLRLYRCLGYVVVKGFVPELGLRTVFPVPVMIYVYFKPRRILYLRFRKPFLDVISWMNDTAFGFIPAGVIHAVKHRVHVERLAGKRRGLSS